MSGADLWLREPWMTRAGWTLVHFLWQGSVIAILLAVVRALAGRRLPARGRYALSCAALVLMTAAPLLTFLVLGSLETPGPSLPAWPDGGGAVLNRVLPWLVMIWLIGVVVFSARIALGWRMAARLRRAAAGPVPAAWQHALDELMLSMRVSAPVRLLASGIATVPAVVGWLRPVILLPVTAMTSLPLDQVRALLAHELAHVLRQDYLVNILQSMAEALLFYHPAVWWISRQIRAERELCCDDLAVEASGDVLVYATALADLDSYRRASLRVSQAANGGSLVERIRRLAGQEEPLTHGLPGVGAVSALAVLWMAGLGAAVLHAGPNPTAHRALRPFVPERVAAAPQVLLDPPPRIRAARMPGMVAALLFDPFFAPPQAPASPAQTASDAKKELATVAGTALTNSGKPVTNANVTLFHVGQPMVAPSTPSRQTDAEGKFSFEQLTPGQYLMVITHPKYLRMSYGARGQDDDTPLTLTEGQQMTGIKLAFVDPGSVSGRVVDEDGDPIAGANAQVLEFIHYNGRRISSTVAQATSGDDGKFKVERVRPGRYILRVDTRPTWRADERAPVTALKPGQKDVRPHSSYYGGGHDERTGAPIDVIGGLDIPLGNVKMLNEIWVHVRGRVMGDPALLAGARVVRMPGSPTSSVGWSYGADIAKDGTFDMANMWNGTFAIEVLSQPGPAPLGWARIVVGNEDLEGVLINAMAGPLRGTVKLANDQFAAPAPAASTSAAPPPNTLGRIQLIAAGIPEVMQVNAAVSADGSFTIPLVAPGRYLADVTGLAQGSYVKSARFNALDALDQGLEWGSDQKGTLEVAISAKAATLTGTVQNEEGKPAPGSTVTLVPDPLRPATARLYPTVKADEQGQFQFVSVTPGAYNVYAWEEIGSTAHWDPEYLKPFASSGERVSLDEGGSGTVTLKRIPAAWMREALRSAGQ